MFTSLGPFNIMFAKGWGNLYLFSRERARLRFKTQTKNQQRKDTVFTNQTIVYVCIGSNSYVREYGVLSAMYIMTNLSQKQFHCDRRSTGIFWLAFSIQS